MHQFRLRYTLFPILNVLTRYFYKFDHEWLSSFFWGGGEGEFVTYGNVEGRKVKMNWKLNLLGLVNLGCRA